MSDNIYATGRRKEAVARVFLYPGSGKVEVNGLSLEDYFPTESLRMTIWKLYDLAEILKKFDIRATIKGGGKNGQAGAIRLGMARAIVKVDPSFRKKLKDEGVLTRDPRMKERKKYGQKRARKRFQYSKR